MFLYLGILAILTCLYHFVLGVKGWFVPAAVMAIPAFLIYGFIKLKINPNEAEKVRKYVENKKKSYEKDDTICDPIYDFLPYNIFYSDDD